MLNIEYNLKQLIRRLEVQNNRDYEFQQIAEMAGLSRFTVAAVANNLSVRVELRTLAKLLNFFHSEGLYISLSDLFIVTDDRAQG